MAKRAERAYRFELGLEDSSFIQFGYWDSLQKGLLAGERLRARPQADGGRPTSTHNRREYELTKHVSLALLDPDGAADAAQDRASASSTLPEALFDLDYPGHYLRRLKSVSLTIPAVAGPYTT